MTSALNSCASYRISLQRDTATYFAGEAVVGNLVLTTTAPIKCRGVRLACTGKSHVHWHTGGGDNRQDYDGWKTHLAYEKTVWGNFYKTMLLKNAGKDAHWGKAPGDGDMPIPVPAPLGTFKIVVRVMDYDWGKKDDLLGEILVDPVQLLGCPGQALSVPLRRKGKAGKGEVTLSATFEDNTQQVMADAGSASSTTSGLGTLLLRVHQATGLRSADMFGKNDIYVQAYTVPSETDALAVLPLFAKDMVISPGELIIPFSFAIPVGAGIPSSFEFGEDEGGFDECYVRYSIYSHIDVAWKLDPSTRTMITVLSGDIAPVSLLAPITRPVEADKNMYACYCFCSTGVSNMTAMLDRQVAAPGDTLYVAANIKNGTSKPMTIRMTLVQSVEGRAFGGNGPCHGEQVRTELFHDTVDPMSFHEVGSSGAPAAVRLPLCPPTFSAANTPVSWSYSLDISVVQPGLFSNKLRWSCPLVIGPAPPQMLLSTGFYPPFQPGFAPPPTSGGNCTGAQHTNAVLQPPANAMLLGPSMFAAGICVLAPSPVCATVADPQTDANNFGGPIPPFAPMYPTTGTVAPLMYTLPPLPALGAKGLAGSSSALVVPAQS
jgi:hypothetical protein